MQIHQWLGRLIALLGIVQIPLGLTLYGSPKVLFILYAISAFALLVLYFILSYINQPEMGFDDGTTFITERTGRTGSTRSRRSRGHGLGALATAGAAGAGLAALRRRSRSRSHSRSRRNGSRQEVLSSRHDSRSRVESRFTDSYLSDEKYAGNKKKGSTWKERLLGAGAAAGGIFAVKSLFNRNNKKHHAPTETGSDVSYTHPLGRSEVTQTDLSRLEEGRAPESPANRRDDWRRVEEREAAQAAAMAGSPLRQGHRPPRSGASMESFDSRTSLSDERDTRVPERSYGLRDGVATLGVLGFLKHSMGKRRTKKEDQRAEELRQHDLEEERMARANSGRRKFTGDGAPPRRNRRASTDYTESDITGITPSLARPDVPRPPMDSTAGPSVPYTRPPPRHVPDMFSESGSEVYTSPGGRSHRRHTSSGDLLGPALAGGAAATAISTGSPSRGDHSQRRGSREGSVASPPVSVKVKMHNDGRHVTLRRLNEEEAAAEREARRKDRQRRNRDESRSSLGDLNNDRWRRTAALEAQQAQEMAQGGSSLPPPPPGPPPGGPIRMPEPTIPPPPPGPPPKFSGPGNIPLPPPPPIPAAANSILSSPPGTQIYGTETDLSGAYDSNRRRRRAERAQAKAARSGGSRVEFS